MKSPLGKSPGQLISEVLAGSWRKSQPPLLDFSEEQLKEVTPLLYGSGAAALGWWRLRETNLHETSSAILLHQAYRLQSLQSAIHEENILKIFSLFRAAGIEPILIKGWAAAGLYPERGLRPYGDLDLVVRPEDFNRAQAILASPEAADCWIDLHPSISELADRSLDQLFDRARMISLETESISVLSAEDHLALLAVHLFKHGAWRPLWLCDIAAAIESLPPDFDWQLCLGRDRRRAGWISCAIGLAQYLLGARSARSAIAEQARDLPKWLVPAVLRQWQHPYATNQAPTKHPLPISSQLKHPRGLWQALVSRWPDPILATVSVHGQFNRLPRFPYQVANCMVRVAQFLTRRPQITQGE
jgi:hypothetical protein